MNYLDPSPGQFALHLVDRLQTLHEANPTIRIVEEETISWRGKAYFIGAMIRVDMLPVKVPARVPNLPMANRARREAPVGAAASGPDIPGEGYNPPGPKHF